MLSHERCTCVNNVQQRLWILVWLRTLENSASRLSSSSCMPTLSVITRKSSMKICTAMSSE